MSSSVQKTLTFILWHNHVNHSYHTLFVAHFFPFLAHFDMWKKSNSALTVVIFTSTSRVWPRKQNVSKKSLGTNKKTSLCLANTWPMLCILHTMFPTEEAQILAQRRAHFYQPRRSDDSSAAVGQQKSWGRRVSLVAHPVDVIRLTALWAVLNIKKCN